MQLVSFGVVEHSPIDRFLDSECAFLGEAGLVSALPKAFVERVHIYAGSAARGSTVSSGMVWYGGSMADLSELL